MLRLSRRLSRMEPGTNYTANGRRKEAIARVRLVPGKGNVTVNKRSLDKYFIRETDRILIKQPFQTTNTVNKFDCFANIKGGGLSGQAGVLRLGMARALYWLTRHSRHSCERAVFL